MLVSIFPFSWLTVHVQISTLQGNIDVSWRIRGTKGNSVKDLFLILDLLIQGRAGSGTLYFTSIRKEKGRPFTICTLIMTLSFSCS